MNRFFTLLVLGAFLLLLGCQASRAISIDNIKLDDIKQIKVRHYIVNK